MYYIKDAITRTFNFASLDDTQEFITGMQAQLSAQSLDGYMSMTGGSSYVFQLSRIFDQHNNINSAVQIGIASKINASNNEILATLNILDTSCKEERAEASRFLNYWNNPHETQHKNVRSMLEQTLEFIEKSSVQNLPSAPQSKPDESDKIFLIRKISYAQRMTKKISRELGSDAGPKQVELSLSQNSYTPEMESFFKNYEAP